MKFSQIAQAEAARRELVQAQQNVKDLKDYSIVSITLGRGRNEHPESPGAITLSKQRSGTGTVSGIGFPDAMAEQLDTALRAWAAQRLKNAEMQLKALGVDLAA